MNKQEHNEGLIARFCNYLGRQNFASKLLDRLAQKIIPRLPMPAYSGAEAFPATSREKTADRFSSARPILQTGNDLNTSATWAGMGGRFAPQTPESGGHSTKGREICKDPRYQGMSGTPCRYAKKRDAGPLADEKCPVGSVSGWFWSYEVPKWGTIYYVDCCGGTLPVSGVVCAWASETNWCTSYGRANNKGIHTYNCTLSIPKFKMKVTETGVGVYEVSGVDAT